MGKKGGTKRLRGSRGSRNKEACDLMVILPTKLGSSSVVERQLLIQELMNRLASTGFSHMALTHTVYGRPKPEDRVDVAIPLSLWMTSSSSNNDKKTKKRKLDESFSSDSSSNPRKTKRPNITVLRRLHVVVENQSDMATYLSNGPQEDLLNEYDLVSICPTNDVTFQSACSTATMADIITLDYTSRGLKLPYSIKKSDVVAASERGATFELPIAPALLHLKERKALVHACRDLQNSSLGIKPNIIVSSGNRTLEGKDAGALALRFPGDLSNLCKTVMHFDQEIASQAMGLAAMQAIQKGRNRRYGKQKQSGAHDMTIGSVTLLQRRDLLAVSGSAPNRKAPQTKSEKNESTPNEADKRATVEQQKELPETDEEASDDGFMAL